MLKSFYCLSSLPAAGPRLVTRAAFRSFPRAAAECLLRRHHIFRRPSLPKLMFLPSELRTCYTYNYLCQKIGSWYQYPFHLWAQQKSRSGCNSDDLQFERSASLNQVDSFASFSHQGEKEGLAGEAKTGELEISLLCRTSIFNLGAQIAGYPISYLY